MEQESQLTERLIEIFADRLNISVPSETSDLLSSGQLDSLGLVELLLHLEQEFGINLSLAELELDHFRSISSIAAIVETATARRAHANNLEQAVA